MPGQTENSKHKQTEADQRSQTSGKRPTEVDGIAKREPRTASGKTTKRKNGEQSPQKKSRDSVHGEGEVSKQDKNERLGEKRGETVCPGDSTRTRPTSLQNQCLPPGTRDSRKARIKTPQQEENLRNGTGTPKDDNTGNEFLGSCVKRVTTGSESLNRDNFDWSNFTYKPIDYGETKSPRAVLATGPEPCSCYPRTSKRTVSSMLYDKIRCIHCNDIGQTQANVIRFDDGWDYKSESSKKESFQTRSKSLFLGYPRPQFTSVEYDNISLNTTTDPKQTTSQNDDTSSVLISVSRMNVRGSNSWEMNTQGSNPRKMNFKGSKSRETKAPSIDDISCGIPRLGYTPQPGSRQSRTPDRNSVLSGKEGIPSGSRQSRQSDKNAAVNAQDGIPKEINTIRTFRGKYFDNATGKTFEYEINPDYQNGGNGWQTKRELIQQKEQ